MVMYVRGDTELSFWLRVKSSRDGCWEWTGHTAKGYGHFRVGGQMTYAHRYSWSIHHGEITGGLHVLHQCDNPLCVRPSHLFLGTNADNVADKTSKGRASRMVGSEHPLATLTDELVRQMRTEYAAVPVVNVGKPKGTLQRLAIKYGTTRDNVEQIIRGQTWKHLED